MLIKSCSVGFGVFIGIAPIWGFQLITAVALSILFRLNKTLVIIFANISIPPMIPLVIYLSHKTGSIWMGSNAQSIDFSKDITLAFIHEHFMQYFVGAITLSIAAGMAFTAVTFVILKIFSSRKDS